MITANTVVVGVDPDLTLAEFQEILKSAPAESRTTGCYAALVRWRVSIAFAVAIFRQESSFGRAGYGPLHKSPGNTRSTVNLRGKLVDTDQGKYVEYPKWEDGWDDLAYRLVAPNYVYGRNGYTTIGQIIPVWAPSSDGNSPDNYMRRVIEWMNGWVKQVSVEMPDILWRGCPNYWVGRDSNRIEAIVDHIMQGTMESTDGWFKNPKSQVSSHFGVAKDGRIWQWVRVEDAAWANGILQTGHDDLPWLRPGVNPNNQTIQIEHEGNTGEAMPQAQYVATLQLHRWLIASYPQITIDRKHILGHYQISPQSKPNCPGTGYPFTRLLKDLNGDAPMADKTIYFKETDRSLGGGFLDFWNGLDRLGKDAKFANLGLPITNEFDMALDGKPRTLQLFERGGLIYEPENPGVWNVHLMNMQQLLLARQNVGLSNVA